MNLNMQSPTPAALVRKFRSHEKPEELKFKFSGLPFTDDLLASTRKVILEIGCGVGWHPIQLATSISKLPTSNQPCIVAIERTSNKFQAFQNRLLNHPEHQSIVCAVHGDAYHFVDRFFPSPRVDELWMLYPNPEMKRPNLRWYRSPSFKRVLEALRPGAHFHFATNLKDYAEAGIANIHQLGLETISHEEVSNVSHPHFLARSHFEKKYYNRGEVLFTTLYKKKNPDEHY